MYFTLDLFSFFSVMKEVYKGLPITTPYRIFNDCFYKYSMCYVFNSVLYKRGL